MRKTFALLLLAIPALAVAVAVAVTGPASAADYWVAPLDPAVVTNNDCGFIAAITGAPVIGRSSDATKETSAPAYAADRIHSGDELSVPAGGRLEWNCGVNSVMVLGGNGQARLAGIRVFTDPNGKRATRLDVQLLQGEARVQVRLNDDAPEAVLVTLPNGAETLVTRGDVTVRADGDWRAGTISGEGAVRIRRGGVAGAPFACEAGMMVVAAGREPFREEDVLGVKTRLPFSFEVARAALPPTPAMAMELEAP